VPDLGGGNHVLRPRILGDDVGSDRNDDRDRIIRKPSYMEVYRLNPGPLRLDFHLVLSDEVHEVLSLSVTGSR